MTRASLLVALLAFVAAAVVSGQAPVGGAGPRRGSSRPAAGPDAALVSQYAVTYTRPEGPTPKALQMGQMRNGVKIIYPATPPK